MSRPGGSGARPPPLGKGWGGRGGGRQPGRRGGEPGSPPAGELPPGQYVPRVWPVLHYGPVPRFRPATWDFRVCGRTESGTEHRWDWAGLAALPRCQVVADLHCVTKFTIPRVAWEGIAATEVLNAAPPAADVIHVMAWADFGYSANVRIADFAAESTLFATASDGADLTPRARVSAPPGGAAPVRLEER